MQISIGNATHGKSSILQALKRLPSCFLFMLLLSVISTTKAYEKQTSTTIETQKVTLGSEQYSVFLPDLKDKKIGLVVNQTSVNKDGHLLDVLLKHNMDVVLLFAPEHGVRGNQGAGEFIANSRDKRTGIPVFSIYGSYKKPPVETLKNIDTIVFDIQDVGTRFYTYISSMHYMMEAAAENGINFVVLDRPNPNGQFIDGPVLDLEFRSFVGMHPIPVLHGLTVGELALMIKGERWINDADKLSLNVVPVLNYHKTQTYSLPIPPSPNLPNDIAIRLYPTLCFLEASSISIGRGTEFPFQVAGHDSVSLAPLLNNTNMTPLNFMPVSKPYAAPTPKFENVMLSGIDFRKTDIAGLDLSLLIQLQNAFEAKQISLFDRPEFMDKLSGTDKLRLAIESGATEEAIRADWAPDLDEYKQKIKAYELYQR